MWQPWETAKGLSRRHIVVAIKAELGLVLNGGEDHCVGRQFRWPLLAGVSSKVTPCNIVLQCGFFEFSVTTAAEGSHPTRINFQVGIFEAATEIEELDSN